MSELAYEPHSAEGPEGAPYPGWLREEDRERWDICAKIVSHLSALYESDGLPDQRFVWVGTRALFNSDTPTGSLGGVEESELEEGIQDEVQLALELPDELTDPLTDEERAARVKALEDARPAADAPEEEWWAWVGKIADSLDELFGGPPESIDLGESEALAEALEESFAHPFTEQQHPRNRVGRWAGKLGGFKQAANKHGTTFRQRVALTASAMRLKREVKKAHKEGHVLHEKVKHAGMTEKHIRVVSARLAGITGKDQQEIEQHVRARVQKAHGQEARNRRGVSGRRQQAIRGKEIAGGAALTGIAKALTADPTANLTKAEMEHRRPDESHSRHAARVSGGVVAGYEFDPRHPKDAPGAGATVEDAQTVGEKALDMTRWAHEHSDLIKAGVHVVHHIAKAKGLVAAEVEDDEAAAFCDDLAHTV